MSVTLINIFEVPAGDEDEFIAAWEATRDYLKTYPAHIETALHQSLHDTQFRFVNIAHWTSEDEFNAAVGSQGFGRRRRACTGRSIPRCIKWCAPVNAPLGQHGAGRRRDHTGPPQDRFE
jgi:heme-degrading monooxygenase HmoA